MQTGHKKTYDAWAQPLLALLFVAVIMASNSLFRSIRWDLTENQLYTMSQGTRNILGGLQEPINLYFFFSSDASRDIPSVRNYANRVRELLEEFSANSGGKIHLRVIDPVPFSEEEEMATEFGLTPVPIGTSGENIYFGLAGTNMVDDASTIAFFHPDKENFLEYDLAKLVYSLDHPQRPVIGVLSSLPMQRDFDPATQQIRQAWVIADQAEQLFQLRTLSAKLDQVDEDIDLLLLVHPKNLPEQTLYAIDQFVMRGGRALIFVDPFAESEAPAVDQENLLASRTGSQSSNLGPLFSAWGIRYNPGQVIADEQLALSVTMGPGRPSIRHLAFLGFGPGQFNRNDIITAKLDLVNVATAGVFELEGHSTLTMTPLLQTSSRAMPVTTDRFTYMPDPAALRNGFEPTGQIYTVAARLSGPLESAFPNGPPSTDTEASGHLKASITDATIILVADTDLLTDRFWVQVQSFLDQRLATAFANNGDLLVNALDNLSGSSDLISIRGRAGYTRPFSRVEALRREAETRLQAKEQELEQQLKTTEDSLARLQSQRLDQNTVLLSDEQSVELHKFLDEKVRIQKELRQVRLELDREIDRLGSRLKFINIGLIPLALTLALVLWIALASQRRRNRKAA
ncbi:MAG: Gldg family protein [Gammaproteobacteria bacterium]|nr:Gldg family protein [Gammaproteobacteria bacterium]